MAHTITVTQILNDPDADSDDAVYEIGGTHDGSCTAYRECLKSSHRHPTSEEYGDREGEWSTKRVPEVHTYIDGVWMLPTGECGLNLAFAYDNPEFQMTEVGVYDVEVDWDGDWWLAHLTLRSPEEPSHD